MKQTYFASPLLALIFCASLVAPVFAAEQAADAQPAPAKAEVAAVDAKEASKAEAIVKELYAEITQSMKEGEKLGFEGRFAKLKPVIEESFDLPRMTRLAAGAGWLKAEQAQKEQLISHFSDFSVASYASRFKKWDGENFEVTGHKTAPNGDLIVETLLKFTDGTAPIPLNYLLRQDKKLGWKINDVYLDATISELATRRGEFSAVIRDSGVPALIDMLGNKVEEMRKS